MYTSVFIYCYCFYAGDYLENSRSKIALGVKHFTDIKLLESIEEKKAESNLSFDIFESDDKNENDMEDNASTKKETILYERIISSSKEKSKECRSRVIEENIKINFEIEANVSFPAKSAHISMWDFAGEDVFYATHHVFLSPDAVYLIVIDLSNADTNNITEVGKCGIFFS